MARMKKAEVITALTELGLEIGENEKYNSLCKKLKAAQTGEGATGMTTVKSGANHIEIPKDLYERARKKIGLRDDQIASYPNAEALKQYCDGIHPQSNPDARIKEGAPVVHPKFADNMPDSFTLDSVQEANFVTTNREQFDRANLQSFLRNINRKYGTQKPVRIVQDTSFVVVKRELVTTFTIYFK